MPVSPAAVLSACQQVDAAVRSDQRYAHTSAFRVVIDGEVAYAARYRGPAVAEVFSVTKTVLATVAGVAARLGRLPPLDDAVDPHVRAACGVDLSATPSAGQTWRQLLTMTRGARVDGPYEGRLWLDGGRWQGQPLADPAFLAAMVRPQSAGGPPEDCAYGLLTWVAADHFFAGGWAGQHVVVVPAARAVVVVTGDPRFRLGPPPTDELPPYWRPALELVRTHLLPVLCAG